jgi:alginate O-acetyltransferase complex protein AlgI
MVFGYSIQIFSDFAGYSIIALGLSALLGYELIKNFNYPYISTSFSEFWTRWHISLSSWLKEYLYFPLGGNRKGAIRTYFNLFVVMLLGGIWHGATWNFAVWGMVHGMALLIERLIENHTKPIKTKIFKIFKGILVFLVVTLAWLFFKLSDFNEVIKFYQALFQGDWGGFYIGEKEFFILIYTLPILIYYGQYLASRNLNWFNSNKHKMEVPMYAMMLFGIITNAGFGGSFIYFRF